MSHRRVVVTGLGMITPLGGDAESSWKALREGQSGVGPITLFDARTFATRIAGEVRGFDLARYRSDVARWAEHGRCTRLGLAAATMAADMAGLDHPAIDRDRMGIYLGAGEGQHDFNAFVALVQRTSRNGRVDTAAFTRLGPRSLHPTREEDQEPGGLAGTLASVFAAYGPNSMCQTACAASAQAIGEAAEIIRRDEADIMMTGGAHSMIHPFGVTGFILLTAMSTRNDDPTRASRPFDRDRDGFVLGEGAGILILEERNHALRRGVNILGELAGHASTADAFRLTDSHETGRGAIAAMREALADARVDPSEIDYINAHGTSTATNDSIETLAVKRLFGVRAYKIPMSSTKSMTGHLVSAGGAVEAIACLLSLRDGVVPPTINRDTPDPDCDLDYVPHQARQYRLSVVLSNSFGFGGQNTSLVLRRHAG